MEAHTIGTVGAIAESGNTFGDSTELLEGQGSATEVGFGALPRDKSGMIVLEARLGEHVDLITQDSAEETLALFFNSREAECLYLTLWEDLMDSEAFMGLPHFPKQFHSVKAVEYVGRHLNCTSISVKEVRIVIYVYKLCNSPEDPEEGNALVHGEITELPTLRFEGIWDRLVFDEDIRGNLVRLMANMLKFSEALRRLDLQPRMNRLILLAGPPGVGKSTLSQALAQKLSIRLSSRYTSVKLIQINAATLLSKFFSESAKYILQIFTSIERMCLGNPKHFICVLIDEIESLASSRAMASNRGEVQDGIRATNALLTGFDRIKSQPNLIILCTSNMADTLDAAFLDRCGYQIVIEAPSLAGRYQILRDAIQDLIDGGIIIVDGDVGIPSYRDAQLELLTEPKKPGSMLNALCEFLEASAYQNPLSSPRPSARFLGQLPEVALAERMMADSCPLDQALEHMTCFVKDNRKFSVGNKRNSPSGLGGNDRKKLTKISYSDSSSILECHIA